MPTVIELARVSNDVYEGTNFPDSGRSNLGNDWNRDYPLRQENSGFFGAIYHKGNYCVVAFRGTDGWNDFGSDASLARGGMPSQCGAAMNLLNRAKQRSVGKKCIITGHSLGGALAQVVGIMHGIKFVTFNAPPMATNWREFISVNRGLIPVNRGLIPVDAGSNFRLDKDLVSSSSWGGQHIGALYTLQSDFGALDAHKIVNLIRVLQGSADGGRRHIEGTQIEH